MVITVTIRPNGARTEIRGLPWTGNSRDNYTVLEAAIGASRRGQVTYDRTGRFFSVARGHTGALIAGSSDLSVGHRLSPPPMRSIRRR